MDLFYSHAKEQRLVPLLRRVHFNAAMLEARLLLSGAWRCVPAWVSCARAPRTQAAHTTPSAHAGCWQARVWPTTGRTGGSHLHASWAGRAPPQASALIAVRTQVNARLHRLEQERVALDRERMQAYAARVAKQISRQQSAAAAQEDVEDADLYKQVGRAGLLLLQHTACLAAQLPLSSWAEPPSFGCVPCFEGTVACAAGASMCMTC